jgi:hypothetical protein
MRPDSKVRPEFLAALTELLTLVIQSLQSVARRALPVKMYLAGGTAVHLYTAARVSRDVDAVFSRRIAIPAGLQAPYRDADGATRYLYFDLQYNDTFAPMHEGAHDDALPLTLAGIDNKVLDVRLLTPVDVAVSKLGRFSDIDRADIEALARAGLVNSRALRKRGEAALGGIVGDLTRLRGSIELACRLVESIETQLSRPIRR